MKIKLTIILIFISILNGFSQFEILNEVVKIDVQKEINMLSNSKSYVKTLEFFESDKLTKKYTEESYYNYDSLRFCFMHDDKFYETVDSYCELKKVSENLKIQVAHYLQDDEHEQQSMYIYGSGNQIDSVRVLENGQFDKLIRFSYTNSKLIEKEYDSKSFGKRKMSYYYTRNQMIIEHRKEDVYTGKTVYTVQDTIVKVNSYDKNNVITEKKEIVVLTNDEKKTTEKREYDILKTGERKLTNKVRYTYMDDKTEIVEERPEHQIITKTLIDKWAEERIVETHWLQSNKKRVTKFIYF